VLVGRIRLIPAAAKAATQRPPPWRANATVDLSGGS
jgi:hypothetical protein